MASRVSASSATTSIDTNRVTSPRSTPAASGCPTLRAQALRSRVCCQRRRSILEAFADPAWLEIEDAWLSGRIGSRECLTRQMALVSATRDQVDQLLDEIGVDPGFAMLLETCAARAVPVHIVSDGFDYCIDRILGRPDLKMLAGLTDS